MKRSLLLLSTLLGGFLLASCGDEGNVTLPRAVDSPAGPSSELPYLSTGQEGEILLSWVEHTGPGDTVSLRYAGWEDGGWGEAREISAGDDWFVNWADFPSVVGSGGNAVAAHWLHKVPGNTYSYDVNISMKNGPRWTQPVTPHDDGTATEHGFVSMIPRQEGSVLALWLDGRRTAGRADNEYFDLDKAMTLRSAVIGPDGTVSGGQRVDSAVCDCCQTDLAAIPGGAIAAYRDRAAGEIRDIAVSRYIDGAWSEGRIVHSDGWKIGGCPVNGPALASSDSTVVLAWYTGADDRKRVRAAISRDAGRTFGSPVELNNGTPLGRVDAAITSNRKIFVSWMERQEGEEASFVVREIVSGELSPPLTVAGMDPSRSSGFPRMTASGTRLLFAWTHIGEESRVRTAQMETGD